MLYIFFGDYEAICGDDELLFQQVVNQLKDEGYTITYHGAPSSSIAMFEVRKKQEEAV